MSTFAEFASKTGPSKATVVKNWKYKPDYSPALDFYKDIRDALPEYCLKRTDENGLEEIIDSTSPKKRDHFKQAVEGFLTWKKSKSGSWRDPPRASWISHGVEIKVAPEIGFRNDDGVVTWVKLYFRSQKLKKYQADIYLEIMANAFDVSRSSDVVVSVLDVKEAREYLASGSRPAINSLLHAEAAYWTVLWSGI